MPAEFSRGNATQEDIYNHLLCCDSSFIPPLGSRVDIATYALKLVKKAETFEVWDNGKLVGLVAAYCNDPKRNKAFITSVSVLHAWQGKHLASELLISCLKYLYEHGFIFCELEVGEENRAAISLYEKFGFTTVCDNNNLLKMAIDFRKNSQMNDQRDYDSEISDTADHQYAYNFDFDVMHPYMIRSFKPFFRSGNLLELGSFKGDFTRRFMEYFDDITCVEASNEAIEEAKKNLGDKPTFIHSKFETVTLPNRYVNIILTHVLEHIDDPVVVLKRINDEWLSDEGRLFLVCPNANAPSRQIAVKMGLISHNSAVTPAEEKHGHRCTYTMDTLERDAVAAGLKVVHRSGVFFKALANFQWDRLLQTDIISREYLDGCYKLGQQYPDLCSSIFLMCERGD